MEIMKKKVEKNKKIIYNMKDLKKQGKKYEYTFMWK